MCKTFPFCINSLVFVIFISFVIMALLTEDGNILLWFCLGFPLWSVILRNFYIPCTTCMPFEKCLGPFYKIYYWIFLRSLNILAINPCQMYSWANIPSHSTGCLFSLFIVFCSVKKCRRPPGGFSFIEEQLSPIWPYLAPFLWYVQSWLSFVFIS